MLFIISQTEKLFLHGYRINQYVKIWLMKLYNNPIFLVYKIHIINLLISKSLIILKMGLLLSTGFSTGLQKILQPQHNLLHHPVLESGIEDQHFFLRIAEEQ